MISKIFIFQISAEKSRIQIAEAEVQAIQAQCDNLQQRLSEVELRLMYLHEYHGYSASLDVYLDQYYWNFPLILASTCIRDLSNDMFAYSSGVSPFRKE